MSTTAWSKNHLTTVFVTQSTDPHIKNGVTDSDSDIEINPSVPTNAFMRNSVMEVINLTSESELEEVEPSSSSQSSRPSSSQNSNEDPIEIIDSEPENAQNPDPDPNICQNRYSEPVLSIFGEF